MMFLEYFEQLGEVGDETPSIEFLQERCDPTKENFADFWGTEDSFTCMEFQSGVYLVSVTDYIQMSAALALAFILLLPDVGDKRPQVGFTPNTAFISVILLAATLASVPPHWTITLGFPPVAIIGLVFMWSSVGFPLRSYVKNRTIRSAIIHKYVDAIGMDKTSRAPFIQACIGVG